MHELYFSLDNIFLKDTTETSLIFPQHSIISGDIINISLNMNFGKQFDFNLVLYNKNGEPKYKAEKNNINFPSGSKMSIGDILEINITPILSNMSFDFINLTMTLENSNTFVNTFETFTKNLETVEKINVPNKTCLHSALCVFKTKNKKNNLPCNLEIFNIFDKSVYKTDNMIANTERHGYTAILFKINSKVKVNSGYYIKINLEDLSNIENVKLMCTFSNKNTKENYTLKPKTRTKYKEEYKVFLTILFALFILFFLFSINRI